MKTFLVSTFAILTVLLFHSSDYVISHPEQTTVYVCDSPSATKYHLSSSCKGLNGCEHKIIKVTKDEAVRQGKKTLCGWED